MSEEIVDVSLGTLSEVNLNTRHNDAVSLFGLDVTNKNNALVEVKKSNNSLRVAAESRPFKVEKEHTTISGSPSTIETSKTSFITKDAMINGVEFTSSVENDSVTQVHVNATATAMFVGCTFRRSSSGAGTTMVIVDSGAFAIFIGCKFLQGTYPVLNNASVGYCTLIGCYNVGGTGNYNDPDGNAVTTLGSL
tara:strand:- start:3013 stop:3591 length:579 start_codon:yes stop_codon:yes gene_type:complete